MDNGPEMSTRGDLGGLRLKVWEKFALVFTLSQDASVSIQMVEIMIIFSH